MYKTLLLLMLFISCLFISCRAKRQEITTKETNNEIIKERSVTYKDTTIFAPRAETTLNIPISNLGFKQDLNTISKPKKFTQKNAQAIIDVTIDNDQLKITATCDSVALRAKIKSEIEREFSNKSKSELSETKITKPPNGLHTIVVFLIGFGVCFLLKTFKIV
jgi:hypothetical protein